MSTASEPLVLATYLAYLVTAATTWTRSKHTSCTQPVAIALTLVPLVHLSIRLVREHGVPTPLPRALLIVGFAIVASCIARVLSRSWWIALAVLPGFAWLAYRCATSLTSPPFEYVLAPIGVSITAIVATVLGDDVSIDRARASAFLLAGWWGPCYGIAEYLGNHDRANMCALLFLLAISVVQLLPPSWTRETHTGRSLPPQPASPSHSSSP